jgi:hypothetical protein
MYLAKHVGGWGARPGLGSSITADHSTVCYALKRIEALREADPEVDALLTNLADEIRSAPVPQPKIRSSREPNVRMVQFANRFDDEFLDALADRIVERFKTRGCQCESSSAICGEAGIVLEEPEASLTDSSRSLGGA